MSLSSRVTNRIVDTINTTFASLGHANGQRMPKSTDNREPAAWELYVAKHVLRLAEKRKEAAEAAAVMAGVINDKDNAPLPSGTRQMIYNGQVVDVMVEVRNASERVDVTKVVAHLAAAGVKQTLLDEAVKQATRTTKPAHVFTPMLATNDTPTK
jgi:hypothetical protein